MANISNANSVLTLAASVLPVPQLITGFASDDSFATTAVKPNEVLMGVDGIMSYGFVFTTKPMSITLQADSPSAIFFDAIVGTEQSTHNTITLNGELVLLSIGIAYTLLNGVITSFPPTGDGKKLIQPRKFEITWEQVIAIPFPAQ